MKIVERINLFIEADGLNLSEFDKSIGAANGYIGKQIRKGGSIGSHIIEKILSAYPHLSVRWLMTGEGKMLNNTEAFIEVTGSSGSRSSNKPNQSNQSNLTFVDIQPDSISAIAKTLSKVEGTPFTKKKIYTLSEAEVSRHLQHKDSYLCVRYKGLSMLPSIKDGTCILIKKMIKKDWKTTDSKDMFIVSSTNGTYFGYLLNKSKDGYVVVLRNNPDKNLYPDVHIGFSEISSMWKVMGYMTTQPLDMFSSTEYETKISTLENRLTSLKQEIEELKSEVSKKT